MNLTHRNFSSEFASELANLSESFHEVAESLQYLQVILEENNEQIKNILDNLPIPIIVIESPSANTFYINQKAIELIGTRDVFNLPLDQFGMYISATGELCPIDQRPLRRALLGEKVYEDRLEWRIGSTHNQNKPLRILCLEIWTRPIYDHQGNIIFAISIFQDSSQRKQAEKVFADTIAKQTELNAAKKIQSGLYPQYVPPLDNFELICYAHPSLEVGGDLYDYYWNKKGEMVITLADVMGKGMSAALLAASFRASLRIASSQLSPSDAMSATATAMASDLERSESFITCVHCFLNLKQRSLAYINAGHGHGFMVRANGEIEILQKGSPPISPMLSQLFESTAGNFPQQEYYFQPHDTLILYSDGLIDGASELDLTPHKIAHIIGDCFNAQEIIDRLTSLIVTKEESVDDLTIIVLRCLS
jgi:hypothetical protein